MLNSVTLMGRLTRDPEIRYAGDGSAVANFTLAVERDYAKNGAKETDFIDCTAWRKTAEIVEKYLTKGRMVVVSGRLQIQTWTNSSGGKNRTPVISVASLYFADGGGNREQQQRPSTPTPQQYAAQPAPTTYDEYDDDIDELPF